MDDINLIGDFCYGIEIEGGSEKLIECEESVEEIDMRKCGDPSAHVYDANYDEIEMKTNYYWYSNEIIDNVKDVIGFLEDKGWQSTQDCGIHMHISNGQKALEIDTLIKFMIFYYNIEDVFFSFLPEYRRLNSYCRKIKDANNYNKFMEKISKFDKERIDDVNQKSILKEIYSSFEIGRTKSVNLNSYFYSGTLELRMFDSSYRMLPYYIDFIDKAIGFCKKNNFFVVKKAYKNILNCNTDKEKLSDFLSKIDVAESTYQKLHNKFNIYNNAYDSDSTNDVSSLVA